MKSNSASFLRSRWEHIILWWCVLSVVAVLFQSIWRLFPRAIEPILAGQLDGIQIVVYIGWTVFSIYTEGYRGFQKRFSPRVVARAIYLSQHPRLHQIILAPMFCMGLIYASRRRLIVSWSLTLAIFSLVMLMRFVDQPWRGIVDGGVVVGLTYGAISLVVLAVRSHTQSPSMVRSVMEKLPASGFLSRLNNST